jgi:hypothetical protein
MRTKLRQLSQIIRWALITAVCLLLWSRWTRPELENISQVALDKPLQFEEPVQRSAQLPSLRFEYHGATYIIQPVASYAISGLVVTHNNTTGIGDIYHDEKSVDLKDLCLVWGDNLNQNVLKQTEFWSEPWTCYARSKRGADYVIEGTQLSNNHLIGASEEIREKIRSIGVGDTVTLVGHLINYWNQETPDFVRKSSLIRSDDGNGACEVIFVTQVSIDAAPFKSWRERHARLWQLFWVCSGLWLISFLVFPYFELKSL